MWVPLDLNAIYRVATVSFIRLGNDGFTCVGRSILMRSGCS
jgi:hypothetical protein